MVMLSGSRRWDDSNPTASTCSFFFIKLPKASMRESDHVRRIYKELRQSRSFSPILEQSSKCFHPTSDTFEEAQGQENKTKKHTACQEHSSKRGGQTVFKY